MAKLKLSTEISATEAESRPPVQDNFLLVSAIAAGETALLASLTKRVVDAGCNLIEARQ